MLTFRQKIFLSYFFSFLIFLLALYPLSTWLVQKIVKTAMENRSKELIEKIQNAPNNEALVRTLKDQKPLIFFRVSVITQDRKVLYDSHTKRVLGPRFSQEYVVDHPEVLEAIKTGIGYNEDYSDLLGQKFAYLAMTFDFHGETYILRTAFPFRYVQEIQKDFELGFLFLATLVLGLFSLMSWIIINHFTKPIQRIIDAVRPYAERKSFELPKIKLRTKNIKDDFVQLANTLNMMTDKIQIQFDSLRQAGNEKQVLLESLTEGVIAVTPDLEVTFMNSSAQKLLKIRPGDPLPPKCLEIARKCQEKGQIQYDSLEMKEGGLSFLNLVAAPKKDRTGALIVILDKTQEFKVLEMRKDFIANASHELKTPITIIRGFAETLHDYPDLSPDMKKDITSKIVKNVERMNNLVTDLLAIADIENLPLSRIQKVDLNEILAKCKETVLSVFKEASIRLNTPEELVMTADPELIEMALFNLINNAAKYSNPPAEIDITAKILDQTIEIKISDKGIGIPEEDLDRIFERFYRVDKAHSRKLGGSGLGLSIVQNIIDKHFGTISVESKLGVGTTFTILLPKTIKL